MESAMNWVSKFVFNSCDESCDYSQTRAPFFHTPFPGNEVSWVWGIIVVENFCFNSVQMPLLLISPWCDLCWMDITWKSEMPCLHWWLAVIFLCPKEWVTKFLCLLISTNPWRNRERKLCSEFIFYSTKGSLRAGWRSNRLRIRCGEPQFLRRWALLIILLLSSLESMSPCGEHYLSKQSSPLCKFLKMYFKFYCEHYMHYPLDIFWKQNASQRVRAFWE